MSLVVNRQVIEELKAAGRSFLWENDRKQYESHMRKAAEGVEQIARMGVRGLYSPRVLEAMTLKGEYLLLETYPMLAYPGLLPEMYRKAGKYLCYGRSRVIRPEEPFVPVYAYRDLPAYFGGSFEMNQKNLRTALELYHGLTGGGDGILELYAGQEACRQGEVEEAYRLAEEACTIGLLTGQTELERASRLLMQRLEEQVSVG